MNNNKTVELEQKQPKKRASGKEVWKTILSIFAVIICFFTMSYIVSNFASPNKFTSVGNIPQTYTILESEGGTYFGPVIDYIYSGTGEFQYLNGGTYEGEFGNSKREGTGTFTWDNGDVFTGEWAADNMIRGTYTFADGRVYSGTFSNNKFDSGDYTVAEIPEDLNLVSFIATYASGKIDQVKFETKDGATYSGQITGKAEILYPSGNAYSGNVVNGVRSGIGVFAWVKDGQAISFYEGNWKDGLMSGEGIYHYTAEAYPSIKGTFEDGVLTGTAIYSKEAGNTFSTTWENGKCTSVKES